MSDDIREGDPGKPTKKKAPPPDDHEEDERPRKRLRRDADEDTPADDPGNSSLGAFVPLGVSGWALA